MRGDAVISYLDDAIGDLAIVVKELRRLNKEEYPDAEELDDCMSDLDAAKDKLELAYMELDEWRELEVE